MVTLMKRLAPLVFVAFATGLAAGPTTYVAFRALYYGVPVALILYGLVVVERADGWRLPAWLQSCGEYSYSLYLWHWPLLTYARILYADVPPVGVRMGALLLGVALAWATTAGWTTRPGTMFRERLRTASAARNPCGKTRRLTALSSRVRSSHWVAAVWLAAAGRAMMNLASEQSRSARIGFRL